LLGLLRALPLALCLPLPGLLPRFALALLLAAAAPASAGAVSLPTDLVTGAALGLLVAAPVWAARFAGDLVGGALGPRTRTDTVGLTLAALGWVVFSAAGGLSSLLAAFLGSYARWPAAPQGLDGLVRAGTELLGLGCRVALPALLGLAVLELGASLLARFEESAGLELGAARLTRSARPAVAMLLVVASLAAFSMGITSAVRALGAGPLP
jgi:type III secretory pathway component EscT